MTLGSKELYDLFLALAPARLAAARRALDEQAGSARHRELQAALIPLAVDAALLGADGLSALANALGSLAEAPREALETALDKLAHAIDELGVSDASGARVDEAGLLKEAEQLKATFAVPHSSDETHGPTTRTSTHSLLKPLASSAPDPAAHSPAVADPPQPIDDEILRQVEHWQPQLAEDMLAAFLDECAERVEGLSERLLELEERGQDPELVGEIFRDLHTLKGSSGFAGLKKLNKVAHLAENLMGELRSGERKVDRALIDVLLETLETLRLILEQARARTPIDVDVSALVGRLRNPTAAPAGAPRSFPQPAAEPQVAHATPGTAAPLGPTRLSQATLRIDFEKVDLLLNLVGEIVLSRGQLAARQEVQSQLLREVTAFRNRLTKTLNITPTEAPAAQFAAAQLATGSDAAAGRGLVHAVGRHAASHETLVDDLQRIERVLSEAHTESETHLNRLGLAVGQLRDTVLKLRMVPIARLFNKYQRTVRDLSHQLDKQVRVVVEGAATELDKVLVERLEDPLLHLVRNAVDHGIEAPQQRRLAGKPEAGLLLLSAAQRGGQIVVIIRDDGRGLHAERLKAKAVEKGLLSQAEAQDLPEDKAFDLIFHPGFSTASQVSDVSGRGVGMDVVRAAIEKLKGSVLLRSTLGAGTEVELRLPLTLAITQVLAVRVAGELLALPLDAVVSTQTLEASEIELVANSHCVSVGDALIPLHDLGASLGLDESARLNLAQGSVIVVQVGTEQLGLLVQHVLGRHEVVIKSLGPLLAKAPCAAGATLIGDHMALVVDLVGVASLLHEPVPGIGASRLPTPESGKRGRVLIAEDSDAMRENIARELTRAGYAVSAASDGKEALELARQGNFDAVCTDIMMPNLDGYQLIRLLRQLSEYRSVPIIVLSSKDARIDSLRGFDAGADAYLNKPADIGQLIQQLESLLARGRPSVPP